MQTHAHAHTRVHAHIYARTCTHRHTRRDKQSPLKLGVHPQPPDKSLPWPRSGPFLPPGAPEPTQTAVLPPTQPPSRPSDLFWLLEGGRGGLLSPGSPRPPSSPFPGSSGRPRCIWCCRLGHRWNKEMTGIQGCRCYLFPVMARGRGARLWVGEGHHQDSRGLAWQVAMCRNQGQKHILWPRGTVSLW